MDMRNHLRLDTNGSLARGLCRLITAGRAGDEVTCRLTFEHGEAREAWTVQILRTSGFAGQIELIISTTHGRKEDQYTECFSVPTSAFAARRRELAAHALQQRLVDRLTRRAEALCLVPTTVLADQVTLTPAMGGVA